MDELARLVELCGKMGAAPPQAEAMAKQLLKRADQLAIERNKTRDECMAYLLRLLIQGNAGVVPPEFSAGKDDSKE